MEEKKNEKKKLSYEELENVCHQLSEQSRTLYQRLQENNLSNMFKRLDYLFAVMENKEVFFERNEEFFNKCVDEIITSMTLETPEEETKKEEK